MLDHTADSCWYLFEELQVDSHGQEVPHGARAVVHKALLAECDWLPLRSPQRRYWQKIKINNYL